MTDRKRMPPTREAIIHKFNINGVEGYITVGLYEDGQPGELFLKIAKEGSTVSGLLESLAIMTSLALQRGVPLSDMVAKLSYMRFEPSGLNATSIVDYIFRWMGQRFLPEDERPKFEQVETIIGTTESSTPLCPSCGTLTVRAGACYCCPQCGASTGCS